MDRPQSRRTKRDGTTLVRNVLGSPKIVRASVKGTTIEANGDGTATIRLPRSAKVGEGGTVIWVDDRGVEFNTDARVPSAETAKEQDAEFGQEW